MEMSMKMQQESAAEVKTPLRVGEYLSRDVPVTNKCGTVIATFAERHYAEMVVRAANNHDALVAAIEAEAARRALAAGLGVSEWEAFLWPEARAALAATQE